jgi:hypothetical protein
VFRRPERLRSVQPSGQLTGIVDEDRQMLRADARLHAPELKTDEGNIV